MAATAQDASAPLRGPDKKDEDRDEDSKHSLNCVAYDALPAIAPRRMVVQAALLHYVKADESSPSRLLAAAAEYSPFFGIEKGAVLQEARIFNESHINARQCQQVISRLSSVRSWLS